VRLKQLALLAAIGALLGAFSPASAMGASMTVDCQNANGQDNSELQVALDQSEDGDTIGVAEGAVCHGGYDMEANEITLQGEGSGATLSGDLGEGRTRILLGEDVGETVIKTSPSSTAMPRATAARSI
jgi:hypothetical protein